MTTDTPALLLWPFAAAPPAYQALSQHGGDETWLAFCPTALRGAHWPAVLACAINPRWPASARAGYGPWAWSETWQVEGGVVVIWAAR